MTYSASIHPAPRPPAAGGPAAWYCLRVAARREHVAALHLRQRTGFGVFSPRIRVRLPERRGPIATASEALFPGYLFARFRHPHDTRHVASTPGVLAVVRFGGPPPPIADHVIAQLDTEVRRAAADADDHGLEEGAWVRLVAGCFRGSEGRIVRAGPACTRICVLLTLLGQDVQIGVPRDHLADLGAPSRHIPAGLRAPARPDPAAAGAGRR